MIEYIKFWLAKELVPLVIMGMIVAVFGSFYVLAVIADKIGTILRHKARSQSTNGGHQ